MTGDDRRWQTMADDDRRMKCPSVPRTGIIYLSATHLHSLLAAAPVNLLDESRPVAFLYPYRSLLFVDTPKRGPEAPLPSFDSAAAAEDPAIKSSSHALCVLRRTQADRPWKMCAHGRG